MIEILESDPDTGFVAASNFTHNKHAFTFDLNGYIISTGEVHHMHMVDVVLLLLQYLTKYVKPTLTLYKPLIY